MINNLKLAISENDVLKARRILKDELLDRDYPVEVFKDAIDLAGSYDIFETHDNEKFISDPRDWSFDYLDKLKEDLDENFSKERFMRAYNVARRLEKKGFKRDVNAEVSVYNQYKDFFLLAQIGAAVVGAAAVGVGLLLFKRSRKN